MLDIEQIIQKNQGSIWNFWRKNIQWYLTNQYKRITKLVKNGYYLKKSYFKHAKGTPLPKDYTVALRHEDVELSVKHIQNVIMFILFFHMKDKSWLRSWKNKIGHLPSSCTVLLYFIQKKIKTRCKCQWHDMQRYAPFSSQMEMILFDVKGEQHA